MPMSQEDRIAFSLKIVSADAEVKGLESAKATLLVEQNKVQKLDTANKNLFDPVNALANAYQSELQKLNGVVRTTITEQDIQDAGLKKIRNHFFPNDTTVTVPSLASVNNVWTKVTPFAITYGIGKNYTEAYAGSVTKEADKINAVLSLIANLSAYQEIELTSGQTCGSTGSCSLVQYTDQLSCITATPTPGVWTPGPDAIGPYAAVQALKSSVVTAVNDLITFLNAEAATIPTNDPDPTRQAQNSAALTNINSVIIPALNTWLAYSDFNTVPISVTTCLQFFAYDPNLLAPTKLHLPQRTALQTALNTRLSFVATRTAQVDTNLGTIVQNLSTGEITSSSGLYGKRYGFLVLRLNALGGSLTQLLGLQTASSAQDAIKANIISSKAAYNSILPTSAFQANAAGNAFLNVNQPGFFSVGDTVYVYAEGQEELKRAVKAISGSLVTLNDAVPAKYRVSDKGRMYKDLT